jgi:hypothetical protein
MQISDDIFLGPAFAGGPGMAESASGPSPMSLGVGPMGRIFVYDIVPVTLGAALLAALQTLGGAGNFVLTAGAGVTTEVVNGETRFVLDVPRSVSFTSAGNISAVTMTVRGYDIYGFPMTQTLAGPNANTVNTLKAFKKITTISAGAAVATNTSIGIGDVFGMPVRVPDIGYFQSVKWAQTLAADAGTAVAAVATSPSTAALGDVRGTYLPSSASNGTRRLVVSIFVPALGSGPNATRVGAFGVTQV